MCITQWSHIQEAAESYLSALSFDVKSACFCSFPPGTEEQKPEPWQMQHPPWQQRMIKRMLLIWKPSLHRLRLTPQLAVCQASIKVPVLLCWKWTKAKILVSPPAWSRTCDGLQRQHQRGLRVYCVCVLSALCVHMADQSHVTILRLGCGPCFPPELLQAQRFSKANVAPQTVHFWSRHNSRWPPTWKTRQMAHSDSANFTGTQLKRAWVVADRQTQHTLTISDDIVNNDIWSSSEIQA